MKRFSLFLLFCALCTTLPAQGPVIRLPAIAADPIIRLPDEEMAPLLTVQVTADNEVADWGHKYVGVLEAHKVSQGEKAILGIGDTGTDSQHDDLKANLIEMQDFTGSRSGGSDVQGHGTHCAGIVLAAKNGWGIYGVAPNAKYYSAKVLGDSGSGSSSGIARGIDWLVSKGVHVISLSLGGGKSQTIIDAIDRARAKGIIVVCAAGNEGPGANTIGWPGAYEGVVCVAAVGQTSQTDILSVASFSSRGPQNDVTAPGVAIQSTYPGNRFAKLSGTSMATPYVAGCALLYVSRCIGLNRPHSQAEFMKLITETADKVPGGVPNSVGVGLIRIDKVLAKLAGPIVPPPPPPPITPSTFKITLDMLTVEARTKLKEFDPGFTSLTLERLKP